MPPDARARIRFWGLVGGGVAALSVFWGMIAPAEHPLVPAMAALAVLMAVWWITEAIPLAATALLPLVVLPLTGVLDPKDTVAAYLNSTILLYLGGFLIALAMERWDLHRRIALSIIGRFGARPGALVLGFLVATNLVSMWISNTATAVMMLPIGMAIVSQVEARLGREPARPLAIGLMLAIAYGASVGGCATLIGTPTNLAFRAIYEKTFPDAAPITFGQWMQVGLPFAVVMLVIVWLVLTRWLWRAGDDAALDRSYLRQELAALGPLRREEGAILVVFSVAALLWVLRAPAVDWCTVMGWRQTAGVLGRIDDGTVAIALALVLFILPGRREGQRRRLLEADVFADIPWGIILLFGGGFALADGFRSSGLTAHLAEQFGAAGHVPPWVVLLLVCFVINFLTELTSNTATANMFLPVLAAWAVGQGIEPLYVMIPATFSASMAFMLPVATPPNAIVFGSGRLEMRDMVRTGFVLNLVSVALTVVLGHWLLPAVLSFPRP